MKHPLPAAVLALALLPQLALAHAHLQQSTPADGSIIATTPGNLTLSFSESAHLTALSIQKQGAAQVRKIEPLPRNASEHFAIALPGLDAGVYTITYRVLSTDDNHISSGAIKFTVAPGHVGGG